MYIIAKFDVFTCTRCYLRGLSQQLPPRESFIHLFDQAYDIVQPLGHLEIIKDRSTVSGILDFGQRKRKPIFSGSSYIQNIRSKVKLLLTDLQQRKYSVSCTISPFVLTNNRWDLNRRQSN